jgi:hypothetical protein
MAGENGNGHAQGGIFVPLQRPKETSSFTIGGQEIAVPVLNLDILDRFKVEVRSLDDRSMDLVDFARITFKVLAASLEDSRPDLTEEALRKACTFPEMRKIPNEWNDLLLASGFGMGEAPAASEASPGIGTSTSLSPNSEQDFAAQTPSS